MQISVPVTFDATNQTMSVSDSSLITFPQNTSDFSIVDVNGTACLTPTTIALSNGYVQLEHYIQFTVSDTVEEVELDSYADISGAPYLTNLWIEFYSDGRAHQYSLVYDSGNAKWLSPDNTYANLPTQQWYTIKIVNNDSIKFYNKSTGTLVYSRSFTGKLSYIQLGKFYADTTFYLANLTLKKTINTEQIRYANTSGIAEIWANIKNWVLAHIGNGTLTIQKNGTNVTTFSANSSSNATANITVPTKVSDLTNDSGFLTTANIPSKTSDLTNDSGFITGVAWNAVTGKPSSYTPATHTHTTSDVTDLLNSAHAWTSHQQMSCNPTIWNMKNTSITMGGTQPTSNRYLGMMFYDSVDVEMGRICLQCHKNGSNFYLFSINNSDGTNSYNGSVRMVATRAGAFVLYPDAGTWDFGDPSKRWANTYTTNLSVSGTGTCTTPATSDNSTNIATTAFVKAQGYLTSHQSLSGYAALASNNRFTSGQIISGNYMGNESSTNARTCITFQSNRDTNGKSGVFFTKFRQNVAQGSMGANDLVRLSLDILENEVRSNDSFMFRWSGFNSDVATTISFCPSSVPTTRWLGTSSNRWTTIYGVDGNFSGTITGSITGTAKGLATSEPMTNETLTYNEGQLTIGSAAGNAYSGSSGTFSLISFPANGTLASNGVANIQNIRLPWATDAKYWHDIFVSPNNNYIWHRDVRKGTGNGWRRLVEENVSGLTNQTWDISIGGTSANVTETVAIANGGTGATTRLNAVKNLTSEDVGISTQFFLTITQNWGKAGYCSVANAKSVLGIPNTRIGSRNATGTWTISCAVNALTYIYIFGTLTSSGGSVSVKSGGIVLTSIRSAPSYKVCGGSNTSIWKYSSECSSGTASLEVNAIVATTAASLKLSISDMPGDFNILVYQ